MQKKTRFKKKSFADSIENRERFGLIVLAVIIVVGAVCCVIKIRQYKEMQAKFKFDFAASPANAKSNELFMKQFTSELSESEEKELMNQVRMMQLIARIERNIPWAESYHFQIDDEDLKNNAPLAEYRNELKEEMEFLHGYIREFVDNPTQTMFENTCRSLKNQTMAIEQAINKTNAKKEEIGEAPASIIVKNLQFALECINSAEKDFSSYGKYDEYDDEDYY